MDEIVGRLADWQDGMGDGAFATDVLGIDATLWSKLRNGHRAASVGLLKRVRRLARERGDTAVEAYCTARLLGEDGRAA